ncbi:Oxygen-dependent choline dehydrogenase-like 2 [Homarus americanus]|uniref:Oxygen-dependent choline dehydrogenase-like 2 n=1 Tax=Homarus americanus TaxID=6706 RepID=A0A8J5TMZ5_HOMAM|nr:Oxygen-dependent choline dehydrogenase-like 2 [Homarus americanus]
MNQAGTLELGRVVGGTGTINGLIYARGNKHDLDQWAALGNPGWDYLSVLPYFIKAEDYPGSLPHTECYLKPASSRLNLHILHSTTVLQKVVYSVCIPVKVLTVRARREVILSAGAVNSPKILMLSGVGDREHLRQHKIRVVTDLPGVGQNLQDHVSVYGLSWTVRKGLTNSFIDALSPLSLRRYITERQGPLATSPELVSAWVKSSEEGDPGWMDTQLFLISQTSAADKGFAYESYFKDIYGQEGFTLRPGAVRPKSRGFVALGSSDPQQPPVDPRYLSHPDDVRLLVKDES